MGYEIEFNQEPIQYCVPKMISFTSKEIQTVLDEI
jgi:hypothetical protein